MYDDGREELIPLLWMVKLSHHIMVPERKDGRNLPLVVPLQKQNKERQPFHTGILYYPLCHLLRGAWVHPIQSLIILGWSIDTNYVHIGGKLGMFIQRNFL